MITGNSHYSSSGSSYPCAPSSDPGSLGMRSYLKESYSELKPGQIDIDDVEKTSANGSMSQGDAWFMTKLGMKILAALLLVSGVIYGLKLALSAIMSLIMS